MQVNPSHHNDPVGQTEIIKRRADQPRTAADAASFTRTESLNRSLSETPDVRADKVALAKSLIQDISYPPQEAINKIADLLAMKLRQDDEPL